MKRPALRPNVLLLFAAGLVLSTGGCMRTMTVASDNAAALGHDTDGIPVLRSEKKKLTVSVRLMEEKFTGFAKTLPSLYVIVTNDSRGAVVLTPENITATSGGKPVAVLGIAAMTKKVLEDARALETGVTGFKDSSQPFEDFRDDDGVGSATMVSHKARRPLEPASPPVGYVPDAGLQNVLGGETIAPGTLGGGIVKLDADAIRGGQPLKVRVTIGGETHDFLFQVK